jgi:nucleotide-binding universal stress UspA family protein
MNCRGSGEAASIPLDETTIYSATGRSPMPATPFGRIAVAIDGSSMATAALDLACDLAKRYGSSVTILAVAPLAAYSISPEAFLPNEVIEGELGQYRDILAKAVERAQGTGLSAVTGVCLEGHVTDEIVAFLEKNPADLLVMGSRGLSPTKRLLLGSTSDAVLHHVHCTVLIVRTPEATATPPPKPARSDPRSRPA